MRVLGRPATAQCEDALEALFRREFAPLVRALTLVAGDFEAAADAVQDAFVQAHNHREHVLSLESPVGWLRHVAINRIRNQRRGRSRELKALPRMLRPNAAQDVTRDEREAISLLATLTPQQRAAAALYYLLDQPTSAVAEHLGIAEATVRSHLRAARQRLQHDLEDDA